MKEHAKKAVKHDVELLGKRVSVLAIAAIFIMGAGAASATLNYFGTVDGTAEVTQSVVIDGETGEADLSFTESIVGGEAAVTNHELENNLQRSVDVDFSSTSDEGMEVSYFQNMNLEENGEVSAEYGYHEEKDLLGVHVEGTTPGFGAVSFDVSGDFEDEQETTVNAVANEGHEQTQTPDWIVYRVEVTEQDEAIEGIEEGETYLVGNFVVDEETFNFDMEATDRENGAFITLEDTDEENRLAGYNENFEDTFGESTVEVQDLKVASGSDEEDQGVDIFYHNVEFNSDTLLTDVGDEEYTFESGTNDFGIIAEADISNGDGDYSYSVDIAPVE